MDFKTLVLGTLVAATAYSDSGHTHYVQRGEFALGIARKYHVSLLELQVANTDPLHMIRPGEKILITQEQPRFLQPLSQDALDLAVQNFESAQTKGTLISNRLSKDRLQRLSQDLPYMLAAREIMYSLHPKLERVSLDKLLAMPLVEGIDTKDPMQVYGDGAPKELARTPVRHTLGIDFRNAAHDRNTSYQMGLAILYWKMLERAPVVSHNNFGKVRRNVDYSKALPLKSALIAYNGGRRSYPLIVVTVARDLKKIGFISIVENHINPKKNYAYNDN